MDRLGPPFTLLDPPPHTHTHTHTHTNTHTHTYTHTHTNAHTHKHTHTNAHTHTYTHAHTHTHTHACTQMNMHYTQADSHKIVEALFTTPFEKGFCFTNENSSIFIKVIAASPVPWGKKLQHVCV